MSKLRKALLNTAHDGDRVPVFENIAINFKSEEVLRDPYYNDYLIQRRVQMTLGNQVIYNPELKSNDNFTDIIDHKLVDAITEEIYGEYRKPLRDVLFRLHALGPRFKEEYKLIEDVLESMFGEIK